MIHEYYYLMRLKLTNFKRLCQKTNKYDDIFIKKEKPLVFYHKG